ncbi:MAG: nucleotide sugar dehydrogenase, partial [Candidatus Margulisbacteria bacterium]|nr:nucleotide sugar dehydrogenase [Candidatus Margulisiibacteriota bacterium]
MSLKISVIGAGYIGLVTAACLASDGFEVVCVEKDGAKLQLLKNGEAPFHEPGLKDLLRAGTASKKLEFTSDIEEAINVSRFFFICVGTPSLATGQADLSQVYSAVKDIYQKVKSDSIIVMKSTVPPGTGLRLIDEIWQNHKNGAKINYVSNPEFLREGQAINDWQKPDRVVIGADNEGAAETVKSLYKNVQAPIL